MTLLLPLTTIHSLNLKHEDNLIESYTEHHGHPPSEQSTVLEWFDSMEIYNCLWFVRHVLMPRFPNQKEQFDAVCRRVAFDCISGILPLWEAVHPKDNWLRYTLKVACRFVENPTQRDREILIRLGDEAKAAIDGTGRSFWSSHEVCYIVQSLLDTDNDFAKYAHLLTTHAWGFYCEQWQKDKTDRVEIDDAIESARKRLDQLLIDLEGVTR